ncbi:hypothetical protein G5714_010423 [Onychostoma macrolepis]|uniref:Uncharacterized protein n=1 Tax=Onychostoma macrolepis TaxID=369639 RepID=A0A7J6CQ43_9TELE|nr:hypothetical protein G5714_010423 [Onychostoma macrolepis]
MLDQASGPHAQQRNLYQHNSGKLKSMPPREQSDTANIRLLVTFEQNRGLTTTCCPPTIITRHALCLLPLLVQALRDVCKIPSGP